MNTKTIATALFSATLALGTAQAEDASSKQQEIICETKAICQQLSQSIQAQINELEAKDNLTTDDKRLRYQLRKKLIALEKAETAHNENLIAREESETHKNDKEIGDIKKTNQKLDEIRGILLDK